MEFEFTKCGEVLVNRFRSMKLRISDFQNSYSFELRDSVFGSLSFSKFRQFVKYNHDIALCDEELKFGTIIENAMKSRTGYRAKYY